MSSSLIDSSACLSHSQSNIPLLHGAQPQPQNMFIGPTNFDAKRLLRLKRLPRQRHHHVLDSDVDVDVIVHANTTSTSTSTSLSASVSTNLSALSRQSLIPGTDLKNHLVKAFVLILSMIYGTDWYGLKK